MGVGDIYQSKSDVQTTTTCVLNFLLCVRIARFELLPVKELAMVSGQSSASESTLYGGETSIPSPSIPWAAAFHSPEFATGLQAAITQALHQSSAPIDQSAGLGRTGGILLTRLGLLRGRSISYRLR
jgi:hypothetical protein